MSNTIVQNIETIRNRFYNLVEQVTESGCWIWMGHISPKGYSYFSVRKHDLRIAHRFSYELHIGPIPKGLTIDHLCRVRCCVNPHHLEPVTLIVNQRRGNHKTEAMRLAALRQMVTHCKYGHEYTTTTKGRRYCKTCDNERQNRRYHKIHGYRVPVKYCKHGHKFTESNTYTRKNGRRACRTCHNERMRWK